jgi:hypothetical protein
MVDLVRKYTFFFTILAFLITLSACRPEPVAPDDPGIIILQPSAEAVLSTNSITVRTFVENFKLVDKTGQANQHGEGHLIFYKDVTPPILKDTSALTAENTYIISNEKSYTWNNVAPGQHIFWVQLVNNDNTVLEPPAVVRVPITVVIN